MFELALPQRRSSVETHRLPPNQRESTHRFAGLKIGELNFCTGIIPAR